MAKVAPEEEAEVAVTIEKPPDGWVDDPDADPPELQEGANEEFLAASRKRRAEALSKRGQRRYNLALRVIGGISILNMLISALCLVDSAYSPSWSTYSGGFVRYSMNHWKMVDAAAGPSVGACERTPYAHLKKLS